jgi:SAM-dependent methyltransferase
MTEYIAEIFKIVPSDVARQYSSRMLLSMIAARFPLSSLKILDLGCGDGRSFDWCQQAFPDCNWIGLDIEDSPEVRSRRRADCVFRSYNGTDIPISNGELDVVFSNQVFEHVRHPDRLLAEVHRVLRPGGVFIGSVSYLEPYHSYSIFNFTPYGWYQINKSNGLQLEMMAAGIDSLSLIRRSLYRPPEDPALWRLSPLNREIIDDLRLTPKEKNYKMLMYAGHMVFIAYRP